MTKNMKFLLLDLAIFAGFLAAEFPFLTGIALHEWLSTALAGTLIVHLLLHWKWVLTVGVNFFRKLFHTSRLQFVVDILLLIFFILIMVSGLMMSRSLLPALGITVARSHTWRALHSASASMGLILVGLHFVLHWNWVVKMTGRFFNPRLPVVQGTKNRIRG